MKAWVLKDVGDIEFQEAAVPSVADAPNAGAGWVRVRVSAAGICGSDIPRINETGAHRMPLIPGHEFAGVVDEVGTDVPSSFVGKRVAVFPKIPCGKCRFCKKGEYSFCKDYDYVGSRRDGAFAEYVLAPAENLLELPDNVSMENAAMIEPLAVAANAVRTAVQDGPIEKSVAVCGMGTIGLMVVLFLKDAGFKDIYTIGNREDQRDKAVSIGVESDHFYNAKDGDPAKWLMEKTGGVDIYFECVGSNGSIRYGLEAGAPGATLVMVGNPRSDMSFSREEYWNIPRKQLKLVGIWNSVFSDDWEYVMERLSSGSVDPSGLISHRLPIEEMEKGFLIMRDKTENYTKVMMVNE